MFHSELSTAEENGQRPLTMNPPGALRSVANCPARCHGWRGGATHGVIFLSLATPRSAGSARSRRTPLMPPPGENAPIASAIAARPMAIRRLFDIGRFNEASGKGELASPHQLAHRARGL